MNKNGCNRDFKPLVLVMMPHDVTNVFSNKAYTIAITVDPNTQLKVTGCHYEIFVDAVTCYTSTLAQQQGRNI